jgi:hypothetical protein
MAAGTVPKKRKADRSKFVTPGQAGAQQCCARTQSSCTAIESAAMLAKREVLHLTNRTLRNLGCGTQRPSGGGTEQIYS